MYDEIIKTIVEKGGLTKLFLDYDGTLVDLVSQPEDAVPPVEVLGLLNELKKKVPLYLVTGRDLDGLFSFVGSGFNVIAMHGSQFINETGKEWSVDNFGEYKKRTHEMSIKYSHLERDFPGLRVIDKVGGLQFHYYNVKKSDLESLERVISKISEDGFEMYSGKYVFELRIEGMDKGKAMRRYVTRDDFILFAGDDRTDEEAFVEFKEHITIKVGKGETAAKFRLDSPADFKKLLTDLNESKVEVFRMEK